MRNAVFYPCISNTCKLVNPLYFYLETFSPQSGLFGRFCQYFEGFYAILINHYVVLVKL
jgi:hypothetical protein